MTAKNREGGENSFPVYKKRSSSWSFNVPKASLSSPDNMHNFLRLYQHMRNIGVLQILHNKSRKKGESKCGEIMTGTWR